MKENRKILRNIKLEGTDDLEYIVYEPIEGLHDILNAELPKKEQKWIRPTFPDFTKLSRKESIDIYAREIKRIKHGIYVWINGKLNYFTGSYYFTLAHWKLKDSSSDYFIYTRAQRDLFYFMDLCVKDEKCAGGIVFSMKRLGKSEIAQAEMFADAILSDSGIYVVQALNDDEAKDIFTKTHFANENLHESLPIWKYKHSKIDPPAENLVALSRASTIDSITWKSADGIESGNAVSFMVKPTKISGIQGKKLKRAFLDEYASLKPIKDMTLSNWHSKALAQCTEDFGSKVVGKMWLIATAENVTSESLVDAQAIYEDSNENDKNANGFTKSKLKRMFIPFYLGGRGNQFIDEYGEPKIDEAIKFWENNLESLTDGAKVLYQRQNPRYIEHVFNIEKDGGLEPDVIEILNKRLKELKGTTQPKYNILRHNGTKEIELTPTNEDGQFTVEVFEHPEEHHLYRVGLDASSTAINSTNKNADGSEKGKVKSEFSIVVHKITGDNQYVDVANISIRPEKRYIVEKVALWVCMYYNKFGGCRAYPERNASAGSTITDLFETEGQQKILIRQLKKHNTDKLLEKSGDAYGIYIDGNNKDYRTSIMNKYLRLYGHKINSQRIVENLLKYGTANTDLSDAYGVGCMACGNFDPDTQNVAKEKVKSQMWVSKYVNGEFKWELKEG